MRKETESIQRVPTQNKIKIRWYHWMLYKVFFYVWNPILNQNPQMVRVILQHLNAWMKQNARPVDVKVNDSNTQGDAGNIMPPHF